MSADTLASASDHCRNLGIDDTYFALESVETVADHILALFGAKIMAYTKHSNSLEIDLEKESENGAVFIHSSQAGKSQAEGPQWERRIDANYLDKSSVEKAYRLETYRSAGSVSAQSQQQLRCYFLAKCNFVEPRPAPDSPSYADIRAVSDKTFLTKASDNTLDIYQSIMDEVLRRQGPVIEMFEVEGSRERRIVIGYRMGTTNSFFSALSDLYHFYGLFSSRKYVEQFSNNVTIISIYLNPLPASNSPPIEHSIHQVMKEASLIYVLPDNPFFQPALAENTHAVQEATYAYVGWLFAQHFCNRLGQAYQSLRNVLNENDSQQAAILNEIKLRFREETFTRQSIQEVIENHPTLIRLLYVHFANIHYPGGADDQELVPTLSYQRLVKEEVLDDNQMYDRIRKAATNSHERQVLEAFLFFNKAVLKTNFYTPTKVALSFRLDPASFPRSSTRSSPTASSLSSAPSSAVSTCASATSPEAASESSDPGTAKTTRSTSARSSTRTMPSPPPSISRTRRSPKVAQRAPSCPRLMPTPSSPLKSTSMPSSTCSSRARRPESRRRSSTCSARRRSSSSPR